MATLDELVAQALAADPTLAGLLATWNGEPAVFVDAAPDDTDPGWARGEQYPRVEVSVIRGWDPARSVDGTVRLAVSGQDVELVPVRDRATLVLQDRLYRPTGEPPQVTRARGATLEPITVDEERNLQEHSVEFDLVMLMALATFEPDPVQTAIDWTVDTFGTALQADPATWGPTDGVPALYWSVTSFEQAPKAVTLNRERQLRRWNVELRGHVLSPDTQQRLLWSRTVAEALANMPSLQMADGSWMETVSRPRVLLGADPVRDGQVQVGFNFRTVTGEPMVPAGPGGVPPAEPLIKPLRHVHTTEPESDMTDLDVRTAAP
jgi:hypothetical protein